MALEMEAYNLYQVAELMGLSKREMETIVERNFEGFPFSVIKTGIRSGPKMYIVPKKQIDGYLKDGKLPQPKENRAGYRYKNPPGSFVNWNLPVSKELDAKLNAIMDGMNKEYTVKVKKWDIIRVAVEEFVERRPEFLPKEE